MLVVFLDKFSELRLLCFLSIGGEVTVYPRAIFSASADGLRTKRAYLYILWVLW